MRFLKNPWVVFASILSAFYVGATYKEFSISIGPYGSIYLALLQMTVIPVLVTAIVSSLGRLVETHGLTRKFVNIFVVFTASLLIVTLVSLILALIFQPGAHLSEASKIGIGKLISENSNEAVPPPMTFFALLKDMIPVNPIAAVTEGKHLAILFFSVILGTAIGFVGHATRDVALKVVEALYDAHLIIIDWTLYGLPFGMFCLFASQIAKTGTEGLGAMSKFMATVMFSVFILIALHMIVIWWKSGFSFREVMRRMKVVISVAFATQSSFASIPPAIETLCEGFRRKQRDVNLLIPLSINLNRQGTSLFMAISAIFISQLYGLSNGMTELMLVLTLCTLSGMVPSPLVGLIPIVFTPLSLPIAVVVTLLLAVDIILDPLLTVANVTGSVMSTLLLSEKESPSLDLERVSP